MVTNVPHRLCLSLALVISLSIFFRQPISATPQSDGAKILVMAPEYKKDWGLIRDRNSIAQKYDLILEPATFTQALEQIRKYSKQPKGQRIRQITFLGHGDESGGVMDFGGTDVNSGVMKSIQAKALAEADSSIIDAFEDNAEVIFYQCYAGKDEEFVRAAAALFLAFSGGTVYASPEAVTSPRTFGNTLLYILAAIRVVDKSNVQHESPSEVSYKTFNSVTVPKFELRDQQPMTINVEGADFALLNSQVKLKVIPPANLARMTNLKPFLEYFWFEDIKGRKLKRGASEEIMADTSVVGLHQIHCQLRLTNKIGARVLGEKIHPLLVEEERTIAIQLSNPTPQPGEKISANAKLTKGSVPQDGLWAWEGKGGVRPLTAGGETVAVQVDKDGDLKLTLKRIGAFGRIHDLAFTTVPIKVTELALNLTAPAEVMETDIFAATITIPTAAQQKAPGGKVTVSWSPNTVGSENTATAKLQFLKVDKEKASFVFVNLNTGHHADKPIVVKPAKFAGSAAGSWNIQKSPDRTIALERTPAKIEQHINFNGPAIARASVGGKVEAWLGQLSHYYGEVNGPDPARVDKELREKLENEKGELKALAVGEFKGYIVESKPVFSRGGWSDAGFRDCGVGAYGHGFATKGWALIEVRYNISGSGWFDNRFQSFMEAQAAAGQTEARAILNSLKLTPTGEITKTPYTGPNLNVTLPAEKDAEPTPPKPTNPTTPPTTTSPTTTPTITSATAAKSDAYIKEGTAWHDQKKYAEAVSSFTKAIAITPNSADAYRRRAMSKRELKDYAGAIADFTKAISLEPNNARSYAGRGLAKERSGDVNGAVTDYTRAIQIDPRYENAYFYRAMIRYDQKDYRGALTDYEQVIALNPKNAGAWNNRGSAKEKLGDAAGALRDYEQAVALDPNNEVARRNVERLKGALASGNASTTTTSTSKKESSSIVLGGESWNWIDPKADASYTASNNALTITAPNGNDLWYEYNVDAPRLVRQINGNFVVQVRVRGEFRDNYHGAGLLIYAGNNAVIRFERGNPGANGQVVWLLGYQNQRDLGRLHIPFTANDVYLKLERNGNQFVGYASSNGVNWTKVGALNVTLPTTVETGLALVNQHNNNILRATFSELELSRKTSPNEPAMPTAGASIGGKTTWGTNYQANSKGDVFAGGNWTNAQNNSDWLQRDFDGLYSITEIRIASAGTDVTTKGSRMVLKLQQANGQWITVDELRETNINLEKLSFGGIGNSIPNYRKALSPPATAKAFRLELFGNGWFSASDIRLIGNRVGNATTPQTVTGSGYDGLYFTVSHNYAMRVRRISGGYFVEAWCGKTPEPTRGSCYNRGNAQLMSDGKTLHYIGKDVEGYCCGNNVEWYGEFIDAQTFRGFDGGRVWPIGAPTPPPLPINRSGGELSKKVQ